MHKRLLVIFVSLAALSLAACGGGGGGRVTPTLNEQYPIINTPEYAQRSNADGMLYVLITRHDTTATVSAVFECGSFLMDGDCVHCTVHFRAYDEDGSILLDEDIVRQVVYPRVSAGENYEVPSTVERVEILDWSIRKL